MEGTRSILVSARKRTASILLISCLGLAALPQPVAGQEAIRWKNDQAVTPAQPDAAAGSLSTQPADRHVVIQLNHIPTAAERTAMEAGGIRLLRYLGSNAYFAKVPGGEEAALLAEAGGILSTLDIQPPWKLHPALAGGELPSHARFQTEAVDGKLVEAGADNAESQPETVEAIALYVIFHSDVNLDGEGAAAIERQGGVIRSVMRSINGAVVWIPLASIDALAAEDAVQWLEPPLPPLDVVNDSNRQRTQAEIVQTPPYGLDGTGIKVMVYDGGTAAAHADFGGRLTVRDSSGTDLHPTHVSGTIGGDGTSSSGQYRGMAPGVTIESYGFEMDGGLQPGFLYTDPGDLEADYDEAVNTYGAVIANNSIGTNVAANGFPCTWEGDYGATSMLIDAIVRGSLGEPMRIVWANGNERGGSTCGTGYYTTAPPACAKNHIAVGALNSNDDSMTSFSSWGPTDDGRLKPDISAPGCQSNGDFGVTSTVSTSSYLAFCGTSMATPTVCGLSALILQDYKTLHPGEPLPRNSTLKVLFAHNAVDLGNVGPDYQFGYGSVRVKDTIDFMRGGSFVENELDQGEERTWFVEVASGTARLKATLAWDDPPGAVNTIPELVNDLDVVAISPTGTVHFPWTLDPANPSLPAVRTQADRANNIEQVVVDSPAAGTWTIKVVGYGVSEGPQVFSLAVSPDLNTCSSMGTVLFGASAYGCSGAAAVSVTDCDLNTDPNTAETITINVRSTSEPAGENVLLTETSPGSAKFAGTIPLSETDGTGVLLVSHGDTLAAEYDDADDGSGNPAVSQDTANVDCVGPVISNVASAIEGRRIVVTFETNEPACGAIRYGLTCAELTEIAAGTCHQTAHSIALPELEPNTTYYYAVDASDDAGNVTTDDNGGACHAFTTPDLPTDYFTQLFGTDNDLDNKSVTFTPDGSANYYSACVESISALPTNPSGGTPISLYVDDYRLITLSGATVILYGLGYGEFYVGSNGYITFGDRDTDYTETLADHFDLPRISGLFDDLNPYGHGLVSWKQLADHVAVTWENIPEYNEGNYNTFQIAMYFDGRIRISWRRIDAEDGLVGLSAGQGTPVAFTMSDMTGYAPCSGSPPTASPGSATATIDTPTNITLIASDDGLPDPPGALSYVVTSLPDHGDLSDPNGGPITTAPYMLIDGGNVLTYTPCASYTGPDGFTFKADDGGSPPEGGESNEAPVSLTVVDCRPDVAGNPDPPDGASSVALDVLLAWGGYGPDAAGPARVLLLASGTDPTLLRTSLTAYSEIDTVAYFDGSTAVPVLADLTVFDVVVAMSNAPWASATTTGNVLADYVDAGGRAIVTVGNFASLGGWAIQGRFVTDGTYEPFTHGMPWLLSRSLGNYDASHPIMAGITTIQDSVTVDVDLQPGSVWVADWNNGTPLVATRGSSVVGINVLPFDEGFYLGDVPLLIRNAVVWLMEGVCPTSYDVYFGTSSPPSTKICEDLEEPLCDPGPLQSGNVYYWQVVAKNCCGERPSPVWSFDTGVAAVHQLVLVERNESYGQVTIDPVPADPNDVSYPHGTAVTLTAWPEDGKDLGYWCIYDPNFPDDANHGTKDANYVTVIMMNSDMKVDVQWKCAGGVSQVLPPLIIAMAACAIASRRRARPRRG
ncbi:MAG: S8 family serine peptidase [Phycisphaerae bacterium]|nr:S8 family serine peptidase [Phycisphaerae bacterium]